MGGAVNIITKNPPKEKQKTEFSTSFGTFRTYIERLSYGARVSKLGYLVSAGYESSNGARGNSQFNAKDFNAKLEYELNGNNTVSADCGFYRSRVGVPGPTSSPDEDDKQIKLKNYFGLGWNFQPDENTGISAKAYQNYDRLEFIENTAGSIFDTANSKAVHTTNVRGVDLQLNKQLCEKFRGILGFNYVANFNDSTSSGKHKYYVSAGYLENIFDLSRDLRVNFGTRVDDYSNFGTQASPSLSFMYRPTPNYKLHGSLSRSFRAPTFNDLYWPDEGWAVGNPNLKPEKCITAEIGLEAKLSKFLLSDLTYYRSNYNQLISWIPEAGVWKPQNIGSAVIDGLELENSLSLSQDLMLRISYTYLRARDDKAHEYLIYQPKNKADFSLKYSGPNGLAIEFKGQFTDTRFHDADNTIKVKRFFVLGLNASKQIKQWLTCYMSIDNLLNERYQAIRDYPMPGFSLTTGVKLEF
jgi:outer membrane cobalamin receptor